MGVAIASTCNSADQSEGRVIGHAQCPLTKWEGWKENIWVKVMTSGRKAVKYNHLTQSEIFFCPDRPVNKCYIANKAWLV